MSFVPTLAVLDALKLRLSALEIENGVLAFEKVETYPQPRLIQALQELRIFTNRVCLIIPDGDLYQNELRGRNLITRCLRRVILLLADRDFGRRRNASTGDENTFGVLRLGDAAIDSLTGESLDLANVRVRPALSQPLLIAGKDRDESIGREAWMIHLEILAGVVKTTSMGD
jgi:hypothetical protein